jgi:5'-nucleotidase
LLFLRLGVNAGFAVMHSGTVAAARQAAAMGVPGIAFSCLNSSLEQDFLRFAPYISEAIIARDKHNITLLNVNFPAAGRPDPFHAGDVSPEPVPPKGTYWTSMAIATYGRRIIEDTEPRGRAVYWLSYVGVPDPEVGSDRWALANNYVSMTPLTLQGADIALLGRINQSPADVDVTSTK